MSSESRLLAAGDLLGDRYRIEREIGRGSFGVVYLADDLTGSEQVAIKILLPWAASDENLRRRLQREARLAQSLSDPHAVRIYQCEQTPDGMVYLVMEYLQGRELSEILASAGTLPEERVIEIAEQVLDSLADAHQRGIIHRDLKPSNIFLCHTPRENFVKVFDFGIAKVTGKGDVQQTTKLTVSGGVVGTPVYMSPEQCRGEELTPASDFYSLGIVLYELVAGNVPFDDDNPVKILIAHNQQPVPPLPPPAAAMPLGRAIIRSLEKDPEKRFRSAAEFRAALRGLPFASEAPPSTAPAAQQPQTAPTRSPEPPPAKADRRPAPPAPRSAPPAPAGPPWTGIAIGIVALVVVAILAWLAWTRLGA